MAAKKKDKLTAPQQIQVLHSLTQQAAADLLDMTPRHLRDQGAPRREDGTYDARDLLAWSAASTPTDHDIDDADIERMLVIAEYLYVECLSDSALLVIVDYLRELRKSGPARLAVFVAVLIEHWGYFRDHLTEKIDDPLLPQNLMDEAAKSRAWELMRVAVKCEGCGKLRNGTTWAKGTPPNGFTVQLCNCPACMSKWNGAKT